MTDHFSVIVDLDYREAKKVVRAKPDDPTAFYVRYFIDEQEGYAERLPAILRQMELLGLKERAEYRLLELRLRMYRASDYHKIDGIEMETLPDHLKAYALFLEGAVYDRMKLNQKSIELLNASADLFDRAGNLTRSLVSRAHAERESVSNLEYLLQYSRRESLVKVEGIATYELSRYHFKSGDFERSQRLAIQSSKIFAEDFLDPQRYQRSLFLISLCAYHRGDFESCMTTLAQCRRTTGGHLERPIRELRLKAFCKLNDIEEPNEHSLERRLLAELLDRPKDKKTLKEILWPNHEAMNAESIDDRFRALCSQLRRKYSIGLFKNSQNRYQVAPHSSRCQLTSSFSGPGDQQ